MSRTSLPQANWTVMDFTSSGKLNCHALHFFSHGLHFLGQAELSCTSLRVTRICSHTCVTIHAKCSTQVGRMTTTIANIYSNNLHDFPHILFNSHALLSRLHICTQEEKIYTIQNQQKTSNNNNKRIAVHTDTHRQPMLKESVLRRRKYRKVQCSLMTSAFRPCSRLWPLPEGR